MTGRRVAMGAVLLAGLVLLVQVIGFVAHESKIRTSVTAVVLEFDGIGRERFVERVIQVLHERGVEIDEDDVTVVEDRDADRVAIEVRYRTELRLLIVSIPLDRAVKKMTGRTGA